MKKTKKWLSAIFLATGFSLCLAGCAGGNGSSSPAETPVIPEEEPGKVGEIKAELLKASELAKASDPDGEKLILYYYRSDANYSSWGLWLWEDGGDGSLGYDDTKGKFQKDAASGIGYIVLDSSILNKATNVLDAIANKGNVNFIIRDGSWNKDPGSDQTMDLSTGNMHFMVLSGNNDVFTIKDEMTPTISAANLEDSDTIKVILGVKYALETKASANGFTLTAEDGSSVTIKDIVNYKAQNDRSKNYTDTLLIKLSEKLDLSKTWTLKHDSFGERAVSIGGGISSSLADIVYEGSDLGLTLDGNKATFKLWAPLASNVNILLYETSSDVGNFAATQVDQVGATTSETMKGKPKASEKMTFDSKTGVWTSVIADVSAYKYYKFEVENLGIKYYVCDPYAGAASADSIAAQITDINKDSAAMPASSSETYDGTVSNYKNPFGNSGSEAKKYTDAIIYEMHIRDWSRAEVADSTGKFLDIANSDKIINHLKDLGVTHVQILPMFDYAQTNSNKNYNWGYNPYHYNVPEGRYVTEGYTDGTQAVKEMRTMIQKIHDAGIAVNMDVVYNHTSGTLAWSLYDSIVPYYYYRINSDGSYSNGSGCGNETNSEAPMFKKYMIDSLKHWMLDYHINGFRFDLMGLHSKSTMADIYDALKDIDPNVMVYGEPWTGGTSLVKNGMTSEGKNTIDECSYSVDVNGVGCFNDDIRNAMKGAEFGGFGLGQVQGTFDDKAINEGLKGSTSLTSVIGRTLNYAECHDNYTLFDKLSYSSLASNDEVWPNIKGKDNIAEYFVRIDDLTPTQLELIKKQDELVAAYIFLAQGTPFINGGQEFLRTKNGDPDSYAADTKGGIKWTNEAGEYNIDDANTIDLSFVEKYQDVYNVYKGLIALRKANPDSFGANPAVITSSTATKPGITRYRSGSFCVYFNATDAVYTITDNNSKYTKTVDVSDGNIKETDGIVDTVPAKSFVILKK